MCSVLPDEFVDFLISNKALQRYRLQLSSVLSEKEYWNRAVEGPWDILIREAFWWKDTVEGVHYWETLHGKWMDCLRSHYTMRLPDILIKFLENRGVKDQFLANFDPNQMGSERSYQYHLDRDKYYILIDAAFYWGKSPEGSTYWVDINDEWLKFLSMFKMIEGG